MKTKSGLSYAAATNVYLDGKHIGEIREEKGTLTGWDQQGIGYRYYPKGQKMGGDLYAFLDTCKKSLE